MADGVEDDSILQVGDAFALECLPPRMDDGRRQRVGFVGARKSNHTSFVDFVPLPENSRMESGGGRPPNPEHFRFTLHTPNQYHSCKRLAQWEETPDGTMQEGEMLKQAAEKEAANNSAMMRSSRGNAALFGGVYQFEHPTGMFLDLNKQMAQQEPAALRCGLAEPSHRTKHTWFRIMPGFRTRKEGEPIRMGDTVTIQSMKKSANLFMHVGTDTLSAEESEESADRDGQGLNKEAEDPYSGSELNLCPRKGDFRSSENENGWRTQFRVVPVAKYNYVGKAADTTCRGGDYLELFHRQSQAYLAVDTVEGRKIPRLFRPVPDSQDSDPVSTRAATLVWKLMTPKMAWSGSPIMAHGGDGTQTLCLNAAMQTGEDVFLAEVSGGSLELALDADSPNAQWRLQPLDHVNGAFIYNESKFFLVNEATGHVLHSGKQDAREGSRVLLSSSAVDDGHAWFDLSAVDSSIEHESEVFVVHSLISEGDKSMWLQDFQAAEEGMDAMWEFHAEIEAILAMDEEAAERQRAAAKAQALEIQEQKAVRLAADQDRPRKKRTLLHSSHTEVLNSPPPVNQHLNQEMDRSHVELTPADPRTKEERKAALLKEFIEPPPHHWDDWSGPVLNDLRIFIGNVTTGMGDNPLNWYGDVEKQQQEILCGLGMIPFLIHLLRSVFQVFTFDVILDDSGKSPPQLNLMVRGVFHLLKCIVKDNNKNAFELYKHNQFLSDQLGHHFGMVNLITEIFKGTPALLHSAQLELFIFKFWDRAVDSRSERFISFLRDVCFDERGKPLDSNQADVVDAIVANLPDDMFQENPPQSIRVKNGQLLMHSTESSTNGKYQFNLALVDLAAACCAGRMQDAIQLFLVDCKQFDFRYDAILNKIEDPQAYVGGYASESSADVRRVYIKAMMAMYVDREASGMRRQTRQKTRIWPDIDAAKELKMHAGLQDHTGTSAFNIVTGIDGCTPGFEDLKMALKAIIEESAETGLDASETERNSLLVEALALTHFLIRQGFYDPRGTDSVDDGVLLLGDELKNLVPSLIQIMDGRDDVGFIGHRRRHTLDTWELELLMKPGSTARFDANFENKIVFTIKTTSLQILNDLLDIQSSNRTQYCLQAMSDAYKKKGRTAMEDVNGTHQVSKEEEMMNPLAHLHDGSANAFQSPVFDVEERVPKERSPRVRAADAERDTFEKDTSRAPAGEADADAGAQELGKLNSSKSNYDSKQVAIAQAAYKADSSHATALSLFNDKADTENIVTLLLDNIRYSQTPDLVLASFAALHHYKGAHTRFHNLLQSITLVTNVADADVFLALYGLITEFRRALERLLEKAYAQKCISVTSALAAHCESATARKLLRNLGLDDCLGELFTTHQNNVDQDLYMDVLQGCLDLCVAFCSSCDHDSQAMMTDKMEGVFLPLLRGGPEDGDPQPTVEGREEIMVRTAKMMPALFSGNRKLATVYSGVLTGIVVELTREHGKHLELLEILMPLLVVDGKAIELSQTIVSKGFIEKSGGGLDGALQQDEWEEGPALSHLEVLVAAMVDDASELPTRAQKELQYYSLLLETIGQCACGLMPHTELQAASMMTFDTCVGRLVELYCDPELQQYKDYDRLTAVKKSSLWFLNDVFIDSGSEFVQALVQQKMNCLWTTPAREGRIPIRPLAETLLEDLARLDAGSSSVFRKYVFEQVCEFFTLYAVAAPRMVSAELPNPAWTPERVVIQAEQDDSLSKTEQIERRTIADFMQQVADTSIATLKRINLADSSSGEPYTPKEKRTLGHVSDVVRAWLKDDSLPMQQQESLRRSGGDRPDWMPPKIEPTDIDKTWAILVELFDEGDSAAAAILDCARDLNKEIPDTDDLYSSSLLKATESRVKDLVELVDYKMPAKESSLLCSVLDIVRAMPYAVHGDASNQKDNIVMQLYTTMDMSIFDSPLVSVAESQIQLVEEGWALLCWKILASPDLEGNGLHLAAVRLLETILGGGNYDVQSVIHADLNDKTKTSHELLGSSCRRLLREASSELRALRRRHSGRDGDTLLVASHCLNVLCLSCQSQHLAMQGYIVNQPGHDETYLLVPDIFEFTLELEREIKLSVETGSNDNLYRAGVNLLDALEAAFQLLTFLCSGPHRQNQTIVASSGILTVVNRINAYSDITSPDELAELDITDPTPSRYEAAWNSSTLLKCKLNSYCTDMVLTLLEGIPDRLICMTIAQSIDFTVLAQHMRTLKNIATGNPALSCPSKIRNSAWVRTQSFQLITILEKMVSCDLPRKSMLPLMPALRQKPMMEWFRARLGQAEVVNNGQLESLYFEMPARWLDPTESATLREQVQMLMDQSISGARNDSDRAGAFIENIIEHIWTIDRNKREMSPLASTLLRLLSILTGRWYLMILSLMVNIVCLLSLGSADDTQLEPLVPVLLDDGSESEQSGMSAAAAKLTDVFSNPVGAVYDRWEGGAELMIILAPLHCFISILSVINFLMVRNPILSSVASRAKMLKRLKRLRHSKQAVGSGFEDFVVCSVHVKELPKGPSAFNPDGFTVNKLKDILQVYGEIGGITMWGRNSQQALVSFLNEDAVDHVMDTIVDVDARLWQTQFSMSTMLAQAKKAEESAKAAADASVRMVGTGTSMVTSGIGNARMAVTGNTKDLGGQYSGANARMLDKRGKGSIGGKKAAETQYRHLNIDNISLEQARRSTGEFSEQLKSAARAYSEGKGMEELTLQQQIKLVLAQATNAHMAFEQVMQLLTYDANDREVGSFISTSQNSESTFSLKLGPSLWQVLVDMVISACGLFVHPLFFAYHLGHLFTARGAIIVLKSVTTNVYRLLNTLMLALLLMYFFAICGYLYFSDKHTNEYVTNDGGPCSNLLTCFVSYSFAGFLQQGLVYWLERPAFPQGTIASGKDILGADGSRILFEVGFMLLMSGVVVAIITGIIVDTFSELRQDQDTAVAYRRSTCFITGIPFASVPEQKKTSHLQYVFLLIYLRRKKLGGVRPLEPLEQMVADKIDVGDVSWLPIGRDSSLDEEEGETDELTGGSKAMQHSSAHRSGGRSMAAIEKQNARILATLEALAASGGGAVGGDDFDLDAGGDVMAIDNAIEQSAMNLLAKKDSTD